MVCDRDRGTGGRNADRDSPPAFKSSCADAFVPSLKSSYGKQPPNVLYNAQQTPVRFAQLTRFANHEPCIVHMVVLDAVPSDAIGGNTLPPRIQWSDSKSLQARLGWDSGSPLPRRVEKGRAMRASMPPRYDGEPLRCSTSNSRVSLRDEKFRKRDGGLLKADGKRRAREMLGQRGS